MANIRFSAIIPVGPGRLDNLKLVLASLSFQDYPKSNFEVIIVNDGAEPEMWSVVAGFLDKLDIVYIWTPKYEPNKDIPPRNKGAKVARYPFYLFLDSDIVLASDVLSLYAEDMEFNPKRIVAGLYHWLRPMKITVEDVRDRFADIIEERLPHLPIEIPQTNNICRDMRLSGFLKTEPHVLHYSRAAGRAIFSGNVVWPDWIFWDVGGFWSDLHANICADGALGVAAYAAGYPVSFDKRIIGGHLYHTRDLRRIHEESPKAVAKIVERFPVGKETKNGLEEVKRYYPSWLRPPEELRAGPD